MAEDKFVVKAKKPYGRTSVVSARLPDMVVKQLDKVADSTGRTRNELILMCIEYALERLEIEDA